MQFILLGLVLLIAVLLAGRSFANANPKNLARHTRRIGGVVLLVLAIVLGLRGAFFIALPLAIFALSLLGFAFPWSRRPGNTRKSEGQRSKVQTEFLEMILDHDTGAMEGRVRKGRFADRILSSMSVGELDELLEEARLSDPQTVQILEVYIERARNGQQRSGSNGGARRGGGAMSLEEAYSFLGLKPGVTRDEINQAHRALMKKFHPDQGGTDYMAAKLNEAKEILLQHAKS